MMRLKAVLYILLGGLLGTCIRAAFPQDGTAGPPVILPHHYAPHSSTPTYTYKPERMDLYRITDAVPSPSVTLSVMPSGGTVVKVYLNGILCYPDTDYTVTGAVVVLNTVSQGDVIQVLYTPS